MNKVYLILENGQEFEAHNIGHDHGPNFCVGEVVFNTSMTGYQEIYTDPSYCDQIVCLTYPLIGNYGVAQRDYESLRPLLKGVIVKELCDHPSHYNSEQPLSSFLKENKLWGLAGIDTRKLTKTLRDHGTMKGIICKQENRDQALDHLSQVSLPTDQIIRSSTKSITQFPGKKERIVIVDFGLKKSILRSLQEREHDVIIVPFNTSYDEIAKYNPSGIILSNGPGDPQSVSEVLPTVKALSENYPLLGICMGHQVFALAHGAQTIKMKFGHRGGNHPVKDFKLDRVFITAQNHGYTVKTDSITGTDLEVSQINLNDESIEGLRHKDLPAFSVQYHPEAHPGPHDTAFIFDQFLDTVKRKNQHAVK